jgi:hypothetical protein
LVKEIFSKTDPTRFQEESKIQSKTRIFLPSLEPKNPKCEEKHLKLQISFAKHLDML